MSKTNRILVVLAVLAVVAAVLVAKLGRTAGARTGPQAEATLGAEDADGDDLRQVPRLLELGSVTCIPCKAMAPILDELRSEYAGRMEVTFIDVKENPGVGLALRVSIIPTQIFYDAQGLELFRHEGFYPKDEILAKWQELGIDLRSVDAAVQRGTAEQAG